MEEGLRRARRVGRVREGLMKGGTLKDEGVGNF